MLENSKHATAQAPFLHGLALPHNFEYQRAAQAFCEAQAAAGGLQWPIGATMTDNHPVWMEQNLHVIRAVLTRIKATAAEHPSPAAIEPERAYRIRREILLQFNCFSTPLFSCRIRSQATLRIPA
jgi:hypothetical protein